MIMKHIVTISLILGLLPIAAAAQTTPPQDGEVPQWKDLFNGKDLTGWVNINTAEDTWNVRDGMLVCTGTPIGVMCSEKQYENFVLHIEWMHMEAGGNSGVFVWSNARPRRATAGCRTASKCRCSSWTGRSCNKTDGVTPPVAYVHGELFGVGGVNTTPDNPRGERSMSIENRAKGKGEWNIYDVVAVDGTIKLSVNGKFVNGVTHSTQKKGYFCMESEGARDPLPQHADPRVPPGVTTPEQTAPERK